MTAIDPLWNAVLGASLRGSVLIAFVLMLRFTTRRWLPAQCFHLLWVLVALKLLIPVAPEARWSVFNLGGSRPTVAAPSDVAPAWEVSFGPAPAAMPGTEGGHPAKTAPVAGSTVSRRDAWPVLWLVGIGVQLFGMAAASLRMRQRSSRGSVCTDDGVLAMAGEMARALGLSRCPSVYETDAVRGPAMIGLLRPRLLLPPGLVGRLSPVELRMVLLHEFTHVKRGDLLVLWLLTAVRVLHWFNPLVWLAAFVACRDLELACDERVLRSTGTPSEQYGSTLLRLADLGSRKSWLVPAVGIVESRRALRERLLRIGRFAPDARRRTVVTAVILLGTAALFGANETSPAPEQPSPAQKPAPTADRAPVPKVGSSFAEGWRVTALSLSAIDRQPVVYVSVVRPDGHGFGFPRLGAVSGGIVFDRLDWSDPNRARLLFRKGSESTWLDFPATASGSTEFAAGWKVLGISKPAAESDGATEVQIETSFGALLGLPVGRRSEESFWAELTEPTDGAQPLQVILHHGARKTALQADRALLVNRLPDPNSPAQIEIETVIVELPEDVFAKTAEQLGVSNPAGLAASAVTLAGVFTPEQAAKFQTTVKRLKDADQLSAPRITTKSGQKAEIAMVREFRFPTEWEPNEKKPGEFTPTAFDQKECGIRLKIEPVLASDGLTIDLNAGVEFVEFLGFVDAKTQKPLPGNPSAKRDPASPRGTGPMGRSDAKLREYSNVLLPSRPAQPRFSTRSVTTAVTIFDGQTIVLIGGGDEDDALGGKKAPLRRLLITLTARRVDTNVGKAFAPTRTTTGASPAVPVNKDVPAAIPAEGKPGFVVSPFAPKAGFIDVRGFPPGTEVRCPYTQRTFRVPE